MTYGRIVGITRQTLINDDLDAFTRIPSAFGAAAADLESDLVYSIFSTHPNMADGNPLFHASHANLGTAGAISETTLAEAYRLFGNQRGLEGRQISVLPRYIITPPGVRSVEARKNVTATTPNAVAGVNAFANRLEPIEEARLIPAAGPDPWFLAADPSRIDTIEFAYGRDPQAPIRDAVNVDGDVVIPMDAENLGFWLKAIFGQPVTTGTTPRTHTFQSGGFTLPSMAIETQMSVPAGPMIFQGSARYPVDEIVIHCAATHPDWMRGQPLSAKRKEIDRWHREERGWRKIGYHHLIDRDGAILPGRAETEIGAGVESHNRGVIHICLIGGAGSAATDPFERNFTAAQDRALRGLINAIRAETAITRITGHNDHAAKAWSGLSSSCLDRPSAQTSSSRGAPRFNTPGLGASTRSSRSCAMARGRCRRTIDGP